MNAEMRLKFNKIRIRHLLRRVEMIRERHNERKALLAKLLTCSVESGRIDASENTDVNERTDTGEQEWITIKGTPVPVGEGGELLGEVGEKIEAASAGGETEMQKLNAQNFEGPKGMLKQTNKQLEKGMRSTEKAIKAHESKIANPETVDGWAILDDREKAKTIEFWRKEIAGQKKQLEAARQLLEERRRVNG